MARAFVRSMFGIGGPTRVRAVGIPERARTTEPADDDATLRRRIVWLITWAMLIAFALSMLGTVILALADREIPDVLPELLFATLGYFGGAFASFMRFPEGSG